MADTSTNRTNWFSSGVWALAGLLTFTLLVRGSVLWLMRDNLRQDPDAYREIAENVLRHGEFALGKGDAEMAAWRPAPTAYRPPLYPVVLSNLPTGDAQDVSPLKVALLHLTLGVATVWLTWLTAHHYMTSRTGVLLAGLLVACDPILLNQQTFVMTETLAAFLAALSLWCLARFDETRAWFNAALAGGASGLAVLCRPTFLPWLAFVALIILVIRGGFTVGKSKFPSPKSQMGWRFANCAALVAAAAAIISPWAIRNYRVFGKPIATTTHGGYTLLLGNNPDFYSWLGSGSDLPWDSSRLRGWIDRNSAVFPPPVDYRELRFDNFCYQTACLTMRDDKTMAAIACAYRVAQLWSPLPHKLTADESTARRLLRYATCVWYLGVYSLAMIGICRLRSKLVQPPWIWGVLLCAAFTAVHTFYWTNLRMRAPLIPFVTIVAAAAIKPNAASPK
jgi:hypothetical protein